MNAISQTRGSGWIQTYSGRRFFPLDPRADEVFILDIAHALSMMCRYNGHCRRFYSVAEHSVLVSQSVPEEHAMWGLLHDAEEAYLADITRPVKRNLPFWPPIAQKVQDAVAVRFGLSLLEPVIVKEVDTRICADEKLALMADGPAWDDMPEPLGVTIRGLSPTRAKEEFLDRFTHLLLKEILR